MISDIDLPDDKSAKKPGGWTDAHNIIGLCAIFAAVFLGGHMLIQNDTLPSPHIEIASRWHMATERTKTDCPTVRALKAALPGVRNITAQARDAVSIHLRGRGC